MLSLIQVTPTLADRLLFAVAALAAEMERELIRERTLDGLRAAAAAGRPGGRPIACADDVLTVARARQQHGESITAITKHLGIDRSTLYRALQGQTMVHITQRMMDELRVIRSVT